MKTSFSLAAPAKLNLYLHIAGRRADGYHLLDTLIAFIGLADKVVVTRAAPGVCTLALDGPFADAPRLREGENLVLRTVRALARHARLEGGAHIRLTKNIPVAAGLGGGSSDAAATLVAVSRLWALDAAVAAEVAPGLGADVPVCLAGHASLVGGIGEKVSPVAPLPPCGLVLVNPGTALPTRTVFEAFDAAPAPGRSPAVTGPFADARALIAGLAATRNDLTDAARHYVPEISEVLAALAKTRGCGLARMTGSGATCFGLFEDPARADAAARALAEAHPGWWLWSGNGFTARGEPQRGLG